MPRAAVLSIHARVEGTQPSSFADPSLVQVWGPRYSAFVVAAEDLGVFTLGRLPDDERGQRIAQDMADRLEAFLGGRRMAYEQAGREMGLNPNALRYAAPTGRVLIRWDGARSPTIWTVPSPDMDARDARLELARRFLHVFGPSRAGAFGDWAGIKPSGHTTSSMGWPRNSWRYGRRSATTGSWPADEFELPPAARSTCARAPAAQRRRLLPRVGRGSRAARRRSRPPADPLDAARLAGRAPRLGRDRRRLAAPAGERVDRAVAPAHVRRASRSRGGSRHAAAARPRGPDRHALGGFGLRGPLSRGGPAGRGTTGCPSCRAGERPAGRSPEGRGSRASRPRGTRRPPGP